MGLTALVGIGARATRPRRGGWLTSGLILLLSAGPGCSQKLAESCSETRSCSAGTASGGEGGAEDGSGGTPTGQAGSSDNSAVGGQSGEGGVNGDACSDSCGDGESCCDSGCVDMSSDAANCGACGHRCEGENAEFQCVDSECVIEGCDEGYVDCSADEVGCETEDAGLPGVPSPFLPMAGAYTGAAGAERSLEPKFAWRAAEAEGTCGALTYEIELTRECQPGKLQECAFDAPDVRQVGLLQAEWTPEEPLPVSEFVPVGALYAWRVRACDAPERCSEWSRVSYVNVGRLIDDINADGYSDLVEVNNLGEGGWAFPGDEATPLAATVAFSAETGVANGGRFVGDVNGDEFPDMVVWDSYGQTAIPRVILGASSPQAWTSLPMSPHLQVRHSGARAGDLDADGFADVAVSEFGRTGDTAGASGVVRIYRGRSSFAMSEPIDVLSPAGTSPEGFGSALVGGADSNADGYPDLYVLDDEDGLLHLLRGASEFPVAVSASVPAPALVTYPTAPAPQLLALDRNGDGYGDVAAQVYYDKDSTNNTVIQVFAGGPELAAEPVANLVVDSDQVLEWVGADLGADGQSDLLLHLVYGFNTSTGYQSRVRALPGSPEIQSVTDLVPIGDFAESLPNYRNLVSGDYDGDGVPDLTIRGTGGHRLLRGGKAAPSSESCVQPSASFDRIGDWCSVASDILPLTKTGTTTNTGLALR